MARLGRRQLERLAGMASVGSALVVPDKLSRSLCARGLMLPTGDRPGAEDGMVVVTPDGYRALADAMDAGLVTWRPDWSKLRRSRGLPP